MNRSYSASDISIVNQYIPDFDAESWIKDGRNIALVEDKNTTLFHYESSGVYQAHYFYTARGKDAVRIVNQAFGDAFNTYGAKIIFGLIPCKSKASKWLARHIGSKSYGTIEREGGMNELFIMTKEEHKQ